MMQYDGQYRHRRINGEHVSTTTTDKTNPSKAGRLGRQRHSRGPGRRRRGPGRRRGALPVEDPGPFRRQRGAAAAS